MHKKNSEAACTRQKQCEPHILFDRKDIQTCHFQQRKWMQLNFMTDTIRTFINTIYNGDNAKLGISLFLS